MSISSCTNMENLFFRARIDDFELLFLSWHVFLVVMHALVLVWKNNYFWVEKVRNEYEWKQAPEGYGEEWEWEKWRKL